MLAEHKYISFNSYDNAKPNTSQKYDNEYNDAGEILIIHENTNMTKTDLFIVSLPIMISSTPNQATDVMHSIIESAAANTPLSSVVIQDNSISASSPHKLTNVDFNLSNFIPKGGYYYYQGIFSFQANLNNCLDSQVVLYPLNSGAVIIDTAHAEQLDELLRTPPIANFNIYTGSPTLYFNAIGISPIKGDIYIDCQPVDVSTNQVYVPIQNQNMENINSLFTEVNAIADNPITSALMGVLIFFGLYYTSMAIFSRMSSNKS